MRVIFELCIFILYMYMVSALDNGLARLPPMGWMSWERFRCNIDCKNDPENCISEKLYMQMAEVMVKQGYRDVGYEYVNIDDCWASKQRLPNGSLQADPERFPHGIQYLASYMHERGLKLGIYGDFGLKTCGNYPGSKFYEELDTQTFANWGVDMLKLDGCYTSIDDMPEGYSVMEFFLNKTGRPILFSCSWPAYVVFNRKIPDYKAIAQSCNIWRNYADIQDSWDSVADIIEFYGNNSGNFSEIAGPGQFNDPDMIIVGDFGLSYEQEKVQMALWAIMAAPLLMSNDLRHIRPESRTLLKNKNVIKINQDPLGIPGHRILKFGDYQLWTRPVSPEGSLAFAVLYTGSSGTPIKVDLKCESIGLVSTSGYNITEVFEWKHLGLYKPTEFFNVSVNPSGVFFGVAYPIETISLY